MTNIRGWLEAQGLGKYGDAFAEQQISIDQLPELTDADLRELGVAALGDRKRLLKAAQAGVTLDAGDSLPTAPPVQPSTEVLTPAPPQIASLDEGERRHASVMFSDLAGYTALNEAFDPEEVEAILGLIKRQAIDVIERHGGQVNQFVGDEVMAIFGVPVARRDDPQRAVRAGLELHRAVDAIGAGLAQKLGRRLSMHTGIQSGLVVVRRGDSRAGDYTLTGDTVNTAARLRGLAKAGELIISAQTWGQVDDYFEAEVGAPVEVKGKERPLVPWRIVRERAVHRVRRRPLVARTGETLQFSSQLGACVERQRGSVILVRGEAGMGKSRLCAEFLELAREGGLACHSSVILDFGPRTGHDALRRLAESLLDLSSDADETSRLEAIAAFARTDSGAHATFLYDLLDVPAPPSVRAVLSSLDVVARERSTPEAICELARRSTSNSPILLLIEDLHSADAWMLRHLDALAALVADRPMLLVMSARFECSPQVGEWLGNLTAMVLNLRPLDPQEAMVLAADAGATSDPVLRSCIARAEGNPLFLEQLLLNAAEEAAAQLPGSIQALIQARMDRLSPPDRRALQAAAVWGPHVLIAALRHLLDDPAFQPRVLVEHLLLRADGDNLEFSHALIRDGAYSSLLHAKRRALHISAAEWSEAHDVALAAEHYERAQDERAAQAYLRASEALVDEFKYAEALALVERGLPLAKVQPVQFKLRLARTRLLLETGRTGESTEAGRAALDIAATDEERSLALIEIASGLRVLDKAEDGLALLEEAQPLAEQAGMTQELSRLHHLRGNLLYAMGRATLCQQSHQLALELARRTGSVEAQAQATGGVGDALYAQVRMHGAHDAFARCVALAHQHGLLRVEVSYVAMLGWTSLYRMDVRGSLAAATTGVELARRVSHWRSEMILRSQIAVADGWYRGNWQAALPHLNRALEISRSAGNRRTEALNLSFHGMLAVREGDMGAARDHASSAMALAEEIGVDLVGAPAFGVLGFAERDPALRRQALAAGQGILGRGAPTHGHIFFYELAIEASIDDGQWDEADRYCGLFAAYSAAEPFALSEFICARGRSLAQAGRGRSDGTLLERLKALRRQAHDTQCFGYLKRIDAAILVATN